VAHFGSLGELLSATGADGRDNQFIGRNVW